MRESISRGGRLGDSFTSPDFLHHDLHEPSRFVHVGGAEYLHFVPRRIAGSTVVAPRPGALFDAEGAELLAESFAKCGQIGAQAA